MIDDVDRIFISASHLWWLILRLMVDAIAVGVVFGPVIPNSHADAEIVRSLLKIVINRRCRLGRTTRIAINVGDIFHR